MKIFLLFHMCHFAMGLTHCYKITVVYTYIEETQDSDNDSFKVGSSQLRLYDKTLSSNKYTRNYYSPFTRSFNSSTSYLNGAGSLPPPHTQRGLASTTTTGSPAIQGRRVSGPATKKERVSGPATQRSEVSATTLSYILSHIVSTIQTRLQQLNTTKETSAKVQI